MVTGIQVRVRLVSVLGHGRCLSPFHVKPCRRPAARIVTADGPSPPMSGVAAFTLYCIFAWAQTTIRKRSSRAQQPFINAVGHDRHDLPSRVHIIGRRFT